MQMGIRSFCMAKQLDKAGFHHIGGQHHLAPILRGSTALTAYPKQSRIAARRNAVIGVFFKHDQMHPLSLNTEPVCDHGHNHQNFISPIELISDCRSRAPSRNGLFRSVGWEYLNSVLTKRKIPLIISMMCR